MRFAEGEIYHIYTRGVEKRNIFMDNADYERFLLGLKEFNSLRSITLREVKDKTDTDQRGLQRENLDKKICSVLNYILMKNHIHLLILCKNSKNLSRFLMKNFMGYTNYFNNKYDRSGVLFQGRSKSKHITSDAQLDVMLKYISLNALDYKFPEWREGKIENISAGEKELFNYQWSGIQEILGEKDYEIIDKEAIKDFVSDPREFLKSIFEWSARDFAQEGNIFIE